MSAITAAVLSAATYVVAIPPAVAIIEPGLPAHRLYVRDMVKQEADKLRIAFDPTRTVVIDMQINSATDRQSVIENDIAKWELELQKATTDDDKLRIGGQIRKLNREKATLDQRIQKLSTDKGG